MGYKGLWYLTYLCCPIVLEERIIKNCKVINVLEIGCKFGESRRNLEARLCRTKIFIFISGRGSLQQIKSPGLHDGCCCLCFCSQNNHSNWGLLRERKLCYGKDIVKVNGFGCRLETLPSFHGTFIFKTMKAVGI